MSWKRARDDWAGWWLYCPDCGHRAYEADRFYYICANTCGHFDKKRAITNPDNPLKNVRQIKVIE